MTADVEKVTRPSFSAPRLLLVSQDFPPRHGGTQTYAWQVAVHASRLFREVTVVAPSSSGSFPDQPDADFRIIRLSCREDLLALRLIPWWMMRQRRRSFDVALCVQWPTALALLLTRSQHRRPLVFVAVHGRELLVQPFQSRRLANLYDRLRKWTLRRADVLLPVSAYSARHLKRGGVKKGHVRVVPNGVDVGHYLPESHHKARTRLGIRAGKVMFTLCRQIPGKGVDVVLRALPRILRHSPDLRYLVGGEGPQQNLWQRLTQDLGVAGSVDFLGGVPSSKLADYYNACDLFVLPSLGREPDVEDFGITCLEAAACARPVLASRTGGLQESVRDGGTGFLFTPGSVSDLTGKALKILGHPQLARRLGINGRIRAVRTATWEMAARRIRATVLEGLAEASGPIGV